MNWEADLRESFTFEYDGEKAIKAFCIACQNNYTKIVGKYRGKVADDAVKYGKEGTTYMLKPNLVRHTKSEAHRICLELQTGAPVEKKQKTLNQAFGGTFKVRCHNYFSLNLKPRGKGSVLS